MSLRVELLITPDCPHAGGAEELVRPTIARLAPDAKTIVTVVSDAEEAERHSFPGSPTIRIGGEDIARQISVRGEEQPIAVPPIIHPFLIGAEVGNRRFYLHDDDFTVTAERDQVGPAA